MKKWEINKKSANNIHFKRRLFQRYGIVANKHLVKQWADNIHTFQLLYKESKSRLAVLIEYNGIGIKAIYDKNHGNFITALSNKYAPTALSTSQESNINTRE